MTPLPSHVGQMFGWNCPECGTYVTSAIVQSDDSLDAAWAEAEAALPEGWRLVHLMRDPATGWAAFAEPLNGYELEGDGPTPAAALRALAAKLRAIE